MTMNSPDKNTENEVLSQIAGKRLTSVEFILNYLILGFDNKGALTALVWPEILGAGPRLKIGMQGYRDGLCALIGQTVMKAFVTSDEVIVFALDGGSTIEVPLRDATSPVERAIFNTPQKDLLVW